MDVRENLPFVDPENLSSQDVLEVLLHLFRQKPGFLKESASRSLNQESQDDYFSWWWHPLPKTHSSQQFRRHWDKAKRRFGQR